MRRAAGEGLLDGGVEVIGALGVEQLAKAPGGAAQVAAALGDGDEQGLAVGQRRVQPVDGPVLFASTLVLDEGFDVRVSSICWSRSQQRAWLHRMASLSRTRSGSRTRTMVGVASTTSERRTCVCGTE